MKAFDQVNGAERLAITIRNDFEEFEACYLRSL